MNNIQTPETYSNKDYLYDEMVKLLGELNTAFYVTGTTTALKPAMAKTKMLLLQARLLQSCKQVA